MPRLTKIWMSGGWWTDYLLYLFFMSFAFFLLLYGSATKYVASGDNGDMEECLCGLEFNDGAVSCWEMLETLLAWDPRHKQELRLLAILSNRQKEKEKNKRNKKF